MDIKQLPKQPNEALVAALLPIIQSFGSVKSTYGHLRKQRNKAVGEIFMAMTISRKAIERLQDPQVRQFAQGMIEINDEDTLDAMCERLQQVVDVVIASQLDDHFIDEELIEDFDRAELSSSEKEEIRNLMSAARRLVDRSEELFEQQKRKVNFHIAKIENELHKAKSTFQTFLAAAYEVSGLVKKVGEDAQPIADAIEKARTITERRVEGYAKIAAEEKPKQLPKPQSSEKRN